MKFSIWVKIRNVSFRIAWHLLFRKSFNHWGKSSDILYPLMLDGTQYMKIGSKVKIRYGAWFLCLKVENYDPVFEIGDGSYIGNHAHFACVKSLYIGKNVLIADKVYIADNTHEYKDVSNPIIKQAVSFRNRVEIGDGAWIGENVCIIGSKIGKNSVVAANSVVTKDIPDYCVVAGSPARILKKYDDVSKKWIRVNDERNEK